MCVAMPCLPEDLCDQKPGEDLSLRQLRGQKRRLLLRPNGITIIGISMTTILAIITVIEREIMVVIARLCFVGRTRIRVAATKG